MFKRHLACLIVLCLCLSLLPTAFAAGDGEWDFDAATGTLRLKGTGTMDELFAVRSSFGFLNTVSMPWRDTENLRRVIVGEGITTVSDFAFEGCAKLEEVTLPEGLTHIGSMAFNGCASLRRIVLPASLETVDSFAFYDCSSLSEVVYNGTAAQQAALSIDVYNEALTAALPKAAAPVANVPVFNPQRPPVPEIPPIEIPTTETPAVELPDIQIPDISPTQSGSCGGGVTWTFYGPVGLLVIGGSGEMPGYRYDDVRPWDEFADAVTGLMVQSGVTAIGRNAFKNLPQLSFVTLSEGLESIDYSAFCNDTSLETIELPATVTEIDADIFEGCSALQSITVASGSLSFRSVDGVLFTADGETLVLYPKAREGAYTVPAGTKTIGMSAFADCDGLKAVTLPEGLTRIEASGFNFCSNLEHVLFPSTLEAIEGFAFSGCNRLNELNLPEGLKLLDTWAFYSCNLLTRVTLPASLETVEDGVFCGCDGLIDIEVARGNPYLRSVDGLLYSADYKTLYAIPCGRTGAVIVVEGVTFIYEDAARSCGGLTSVTLPRTLEAIDDSAFNGCSSLELVRFAGSQSQWSNISIGDSNGDLLDARFEYLG